MKSIETEISINATAEKVWEVLSNFETYPEWNPFVVSISGEQRIGGQLEVELKQQNGKTMTFKPTVVQYLKNSHLVWKGKLFIPGLFDGEHGFAINENDDGTVTFKQWEDFSGVLVPLFGQKFLDDTKKSFEEMNGALQVTIENT